MRSTLRAFQAKGACHLFPGAAAPDVAAAGSEELASSSEELGAQSNVLRDLVKGFKTIQTTTHTQPL